MIRRIDEMSLFKARIPGPDAFLRRREPKRAVTLKPVEQGLLALVDGHPPPDGPARATARAEVLPAELVGRRSCGPPPPAAA